jgi:enediyne biosynthesis protein E4
MNAKHYSLRCLLAAIWLFGLLCQCGFSQGQLGFSDATESSAIAFRHSDGGQLNGYLVSMMGSGLAVADFDGDGRQDIYLLNGKELPDGKKHPNALLRNLGDPGFVNVTQVSGTAGENYALGVSVADYDNDGFKDFVITEFGAITLMRNNGDGTFSDQTAAAGIAGADAGIAFGAGAVFLDIENDGDLDLFVADYVDFDFERFRELVPKSYPYPPGPEDFTHRFDRLYENDGRGHFVDISQQAGIAEHRRPSMGVVAGDFDGDGDSDVFVCCDARPNLLFINNGTGKFSEEAVIYAAAYNAQAVPVGAMGASAADYDGDGIEDLFITSYSGQLPILFKNDGEFGFEDVTLRSRSGASVVPHANWGSGFADFDNDADRDLIIVNGHLMKAASQVEQMTSFRVANTLMQNIGSGVFVDVSSSAGPGLEIVESSRAVGVSDMNNDGRMDCVILNNDGPANYLENQSTTSHPWLELELRGTRMNRDAVGAKVTVQVGSVTQVAFMRSGSGYQSYDSQRMHFGFGAAAEGAEQTARVIVDWAGHVSVYERVALRQIQTLVEPE